MALEGLGRAYTTQGDYGAAFVAFASLLEDATLRPFDVRRQASAFFNIGEVHTRLANLDAARAAYEDSRKAYESDKQLGEAGRALHAIGIVELMAGRMPQRKRRTKRGIPTARAWTRRTRSALLGPLSALASPRRRRSGGMRPLRHTARGSMRSWRCRRSKQWAEHAWVSRRHSQAKEISLRR